MRLWRLRQQQRQGPRRRARAAAVLAVPLQEVVCAKLAADWRAGYERVSAVLRRVVRASSVVECMNSVWRMHQSRHRQLTQGLLDLKRLWWNVRVFVSGKRQKQRPYERLGLRLPTYDLWELLQGDPDSLDATSVNARDCDMRQCLGCNLAGQPFLHRFVTHERLRDSN